MTDPRRDAEERMERALNVSEQDWDAVDGLLAWVRSLSAWAPDAGSRARNALEAKDRLRAEHASLTAEVEELRSKNATYMYCPEGHVVEVPDRQPGRDYLCPACAEVERLRGALMTQNENHAACVRLHEATIERLKGVEEAARKLNTELQREQASSQYAVDEAIAELDDALSEPTKEDR